MFHRTSRIAWIAFLLAGSGLAVAAEHAEAAGEKGVALKAADLTTVFGLPISNALLITWLVTVLLILVAQLATRKVTAIPSGLQNFCELLVESLRNFLEEILGAELLGKTFWLFATIFLFVLCSSWIGLFPGVGTIGWGLQTAHGFAVSRPLLRSSDADLNLTLGMAIIFMCCWLYWALQSNGPVGFMRHLFAPKGESSGFMGLFLILIFFAVGILEVISILFRPISLSLRLYGNTYAGETMMESMMTLVPSLGWLLPVPFYFMELMVGLVQASVFMLLTSVFTMLICQHDESHPKAHHP